MDLDKMDLRSLQKEAARALSCIDATNNGIYKFNKAAHHDSQKWYKAVIAWYIEEYGDLPSAVGPGTKVTLVYDKQ